MAVLTKNLVHRDDVPAEPMAGWETREGIQVRKGARVSEAPANAVKFAVRSFEFPTGTIRTFNIAKGGALMYPIADETELFVLNGLIDVEVDNHPTKIGTGDAVSRPHGAIRIDLAREDTTVIAWTVGSSVPQPRSMVVRSVSIRPLPVANWQRDGKNMGGRGPEASKDAPPDAARWLSRRYEFDGNSIRWANFQKGGRTNLATPGQDNLIYITKGRFRRTDGPEVAEVVAGDVVREAAGLPGFWEVLEESGFLSTTATFPGMAAPKLD